MSHPHPRPKARPKGGSAIGLCHYSRAAASIDHRLLDATFRVTVEQTNATAQAIAGFCATEMRTMVDRLGVSNNVAALNFHELVYTLAGVPPRDRPPLHARRLALENAMNSTTQLLGTSTPLRSPEDETGGSRPRSRSRDRAYGCNRWRSNSTQESPDSRDHYRPCRTRGILCPSRTLPPRYDRSPSFGRKRRYSHHDEEASSTAQPSRRSTRDTHIYYERHQREQHQDGSGHRRHWGGKPQIPCRPSLLGP